MTLYLRPLVIAGCYTACLYAVAEAIAPTWNPFEPAASAHSPSAAQHARGVEAVASTGVGK